MTIEVPDTPFPPGTYDVGASRGGSDTALFTIEGG